MNNFKEQKQKILDGGFKYVSLYQGSKQKAARNLLGQLNEKLDEIENILKNDFPGSYQIHALSSTGKNITPVIFEINTGTNESPNKVIYQEPASDKLLENQRILDLTVKVKELEMQNEFLRSQIQDLESEIEELEMKAAEAPELGEQMPAPSLMESAKDFLGSLMEFGAPLLDQHFALKKQQLEIERMKLGAKRPAPGTPAAAKDNNVKIRIIGEFVETFQDQPEIYEALHEISAKSETVEQFMQYLAQFNTDLYEQLSNKI
jgi:hypothetical protein